MLLLGPRGRGIGCAPATAHLALDSSPRLQYSKYMNTLDIAVDHEVVVIGAGFSGIGAAIKLDEAGFNDYVVLDEGDGVGGARHSDTHPRIRLARPSVDYQIPLEKGRHRPR